MSDDESENSDDNTSSFNVFNHVISKNNDKTFLVAISFRDLLRYSDTWSYNRIIHEKTYMELYDTLCIDYDIPWTLHAVYDESFADKHKQIRILDGQHRKKAIEYYIKNNDIQMSCDWQVWIWLYTVPFSEDENSHISNDLFKKINNNRHFEKEEVPNTFIIDLVRIISDDKNLKKGIKNDSNTSRCHSPLLHRKELNAIFNTHIDHLSEMTQSNIVKNILMINNILSIKPESALFGSTKCQTKSKKIAKIMSIAEKKGFFLNLGKDSRFPITTWIKYVHDPSQL
jgi:hypothetical protein